MPVSVCDSDLPPRVMVIVTSPRFWNCTLNDTWNTEGLLIGGQAPVIVRFPTWQPSVGPEKPNVLSAPARPVWLFAPIGRSKLNVFVFCPGNGFSHGEPGDKGPGWPDATIQLTFGASGASLRSRNTCTTHPAGVWTLLIWDRSQGGEAVKKRI